MDVPETPTEELSAPVAEAPVEAPPKKRGRPSNADKANQPKIPLIIKEEMNGHPCWEKLNGESPKAFAAFQHFRDLGPTRTIVDAANMLNNALDAKYELQERLENAERGQKTYVRTKARRGSLLAKQSAISTCTIWAREFGWFDRADFFDRHMDRVRIQAQEKEVVEMVKRHIAIAGLIQNKAAAKLKELEHSKLTADQALKYLIEGTKLERQSRGEPTEITGTAGGSKPSAEKDVRHEGIDPRDELKRRIDAIAAKKKQAEEDEKKENEPKKRGRPPLKLEPTGT